MAVSDSMFLFEIVVEDLKSYIDCKQLHIQSQFADVFILNLKDPNEFDTIIPKLKLKKPKKKSKVRKKSSKLSSEGKVQLGQSILFTSRIDTLITNMKNFPIELSLYSKDDVDNKLGSTHIPWSPIYIDYLYKLQTEPDLNPVYVSGGYNVYDDYTSKRMATIRLYIKLTHLKDKLTSSNEEHPNIFSSEPTTFLRTNKRAPFEYTQETGTVKTFYSGGKRKFKSKINKNKTKDLIPEEKEINRGKNNQSNQTNEQSNQPEEKGKRDIEDSTIKSSRISLIRSDTDLDINKHINIVKTKSCSSINREQFSILNYIFGDENRPFGNQVYCVGYFTVENEFTNNDSPTKTPTSSEASKNLYNFKPQCDGQDVYVLRVANEQNPAEKPAEQTDLITIKPCEHIGCNSKKQREPSSSKKSGQDERILLDITNAECCNKSETVEEVVGGVKAKMKFGDDPCFCSCECSFGFVKKTTYCGICGGYEIVREDMSTKLPNAPFPCPIFHKLIDKNTKTASKSAPPKPVANIESERDIAKGKKKKDDRFKFNYGYAAPQIGHSHCATPCTGTLCSVPKNMGWLWTAEDVPGMKFRPNWKPGATSKHVVRLLRLAKNPDEVFKKKKRKDDGKAKKPIKRPLLIVKKKDGEYTVTMETMKSYPKTRALNQQPYEDKPVLTYTIGRTEEENRERQKKKERARRRLERDQRDFIQSAFRDMCEEICLKTYQQALGILPDTEDPKCACYPKHPGPDKTNVDLSCSCSEDSQSMGSDTDSDEWVVEFTPPNATFDPTYKGKKVIKTENGTQYSYLDYRVKLLDRYGNPVPRFFKGLDGKQLCSDLGGFWGPDHKWLEINVDGYIAPDGRWAPMAFLGPNGEQVDCDTGKFQAANGNWLVVGVDGFIDAGNRWKFYPKPRGAMSSHKKRGPGTQKKGGDKKDDKGKPPYKPSEATWSCFGDASPKELSKMGILGHGHDKVLLLKTLKEMLAHGDDVKIPQQPVIPRLPDSKRRKGKPRVGAYDSKTYFLERQRCKHPVPSDKGIVAVDDYGNKTYFKLRDPKNRRPKERLAHLSSQGISLSSFHVPCFHSFINTEIMKKQQYDRLMAMAQQTNSASSKCVSTQAGAKSRIAH